jgi:hypothetical protein
MNVRSVTLLVGILLFVPQAGARPQKTASKPDDAEDSSNKYVKVAANFAFGMLDIYTGLVNKGNKVWDDLGHTQAVSVLDRVAHEAGEQAKGNDLLLDDMKASVKNETTKKLEVGERVDRLKTSLAHLGRELDRFSVEVDKAAHPIGEEARERFAVAGNGKARELDAITKSWREGHFDEAMEHLKKAQAYLDVMRQLVTCLQDSVRDKKPACDPKKIPMPDEQNDKLAVNFGYFNSFTIKAIAAMSMVKNVAIFVHVMDAPSL